MLDESQSDGQIIQLLFTDRGISTEEEPLKTGAYAKDRGACQPARTGARIRERALLFDPFAPPTHKQGRRIFTRNTHIVPQLHFYLPTFPPLPFSLPVTSHVSTLSP